MSQAAAIAAGLIDPEVADLVARSKKPGPVTKTGAPSAKKPRKKRSQSRPAIHPEPQMGPQGSGQIELLADGKVSSADIVLDVVPVPKERPRVVKNPKTDTVFGFTPARTKHFTTTVRMVVEHIMEGRSPIEGPVLLEMTFVMQVPKSWPKWKQQAAIDGLIVPTGRPDMDNLEKALLDAFNECLIVDDAFVIAREATKIYGSLPCIRARVSQTGKLDVHATRAQVDALRKLMEENEND
jgi:Holliday junction resolvase RusA-like endonuclease